ncbi:MAG: hypothetical protein ACJATI_002667 [Halioglobus sp.]|jgi:hypothetical protein
MDLKKVIKQLSPHLLAIFIIIGTCLIYFFPQTQGKKIAGGDVISSTAWSKQVIDYKEDTGIQSYWNPSMFSGMPWGLLTSGVEKNYVRGADNILKASVKPAMGILIKVGIVCYLAIILLGIPWYIALLSSLALILNVNFTVLLEAGHQSKVNTIANFPLIISGLILVFRQKWKIGSAAIAIGTSLAITNNHIQMVYYLLLNLVVFSIIYLIFAIKDKKSKTLPLILSVALMAAMIGGLSNYSMLSSAMSFSEETMRSKPILEKITTIDSDDASSGRDGLTWDYAMQWSNELKDIATMIIPRFVGGSSYEEVPANSNTGKLLRSNGSKRGSDNTYQAPMYWGNLIFTSGPNYLGIVSIFLLFLGLFSAPVYLRWGFGATIILTLLLSMGEHASWLNKTLFEYFPLFNKFRTPNSIMNLIPVFAVFLGSIGLNEFLKNKDKELLKKPLYYASIIPIGICAFFALLGTSLFTFESLGDARYAEQVKDIFIETRQMLFSTDAWRSTILGVLVFGLFFIYIKSKMISSRVLVLLLGLILIFDLVGVNRRHLDDDNWESTKKYATHFEERSVDKQIAQLEPKGRGYYRVLDVTNMSSAVGSYLHNTIGGYHAAKLQRYQDMLDYHINKGDQGTLNMLNAKYIIRDKENLQINSSALGSAWFVNEVKNVNTALEEIELISSIDPGKTAILNVDDFPDSNVNAGSGLGTIALTNYKPNSWTYSFNSDESQFAVFSEVWYGQYKGMRAFIDGEESDFVRVNYILRGLQVPAGKHEITFAFAPVLKGAWVSVVFSIIILLMILYAVYGITAGKETTLD